MMHERQKVPLYLEDRAELRNELRSFYDGAMEEQESVNGLKEWIEIDNGPCPEGFFHPLDIAHMTIEMKLPGSYELGQTTIDEICEWLIWG